MSCRFLDSDEIIKLDYYERQKIRQNHVNHGILFLVNSFISELWPVSTKANLFMQI